MTPARSVASRLRGPALLLCGLYAGFLLVLAFVQGHPWFLDASGAPAAQDFVILRVAGLLALEGRAAAAYDPGPFSEALTALLGRPGATHWLAWSYPPFAILPAIPLALMPYAVAWAVWLLATAGLLALVLWRSAALRPLAAVVFAAPAALLCVVKGQNGFLSAALLAAALLLLDRHPRLAGVCLGLLTFKPHFGLAVPVLLVAARRWDTILAAALTFLGLVAVSSALLGPGLWLDFVAALAGTRDRYMAAGPALAAMQSAYAVLAPRIGTAGAWLAHLAWAVAAVALALRVWRAQADAGARAAAAIAASFLAAPYAFNHDAVMLGVAGAFLLGVPPRAPWRWEAPLVVLALLLPAATMAAAWPPAGPAAAAILLLLALRRARRGPAARP